jgi:hypothetical protein
MLHGCITDGARGSMIEVAGVLVWSLPALGNAGMSGLTNNSPIGQSVMTHVVLDDNGTCTQPALAG